MKGIFKLVQDVLWFGEVCTIYSIQLYFRAQNSHQYNSSISPEQRLDFVVCDPQQNLANNMPDMSSNMPDMSSNMSHPGLIRPIPGRPLPLPANARAPPPVPGPKPQYKQNLDSSYHHYDQVFPMKTTVKGQLFSDKGQSFNDKLNEELSQQYNVHDLQFNGGKISHFTGNPRPIAMKPMRKLLYTQFIFLRWFMKNIFVSWYLWFWKIFQSLINNFILFYFSCSSRRSRLCQSWSIGHQLSWLLWQHVNLKLIKSCHDRRWPCCHDLRWPAQATFEYPDDKWGQSWQSQWQWVLNKTGIQCWALAFTVR